MNEFDGIGYLSLLDLSCLEEKIDNIGLGKWNVGNLKSCPCGMRQKDLLLVTN